MIKAISLGRISYDIILEVDKMPEEGSTTEFMNKKGSCGGPATIIACCLSKWGIRTSLAGVLGNDANGTRIRKDLERMHVDARYIEPTYDNDTTISTVMVNKTLGVHTIYNMSDKFVSLKKCDFDFTPDLLVVDGYDVVQCKNILERFPNSLTILDARIINSSVADLCRKCKYVVCSQEFAEAVTATKMDFQDISTVVNVYQKLKKRYGKPEFVITLGAKGALYCLNNQIKISPSLKVNVIDTYGSGTIFRAAFAYTLANGGDIEKAVKMGCIASGLACTKLGAQDAIPNLEEMKNIYEQNY